MVFPRIFAPPFIQSSGITYNTDFNWSSGSLPGAVTHSGGTNGTKWNSSGFLVGGSNGRITFDWFSNIGTCYGLMLEPEASNKVVSNINFVSPNWNPDNIGLTSNTTVSPDGTTNASTVNGTPVTADSSVIQQNVNHALPGMASVFAKLPSGNVTSFGALALGGFDGTSYTTQRFNLTTGALGTTDNLNQMGDYQPGIQQYQNGWYRIWVGSQDISGNGEVGGGFVMSLATAKTAIDPLTPTFPGGMPIYTNVTGFDSIYWGAQSESNQFFPTSPIITSDVTGEVARDADVATTTNATYLAQRGFLVIGRTPVGLTLDGSTQIIAQWDDGSENNLWKVERDGSGNMHFKVISGGTTQADLVSVATVANNTSFKLAFRIATNDFSMSLNGASVVTDSSGSVPTGITTGRFGCDSDGNNYWCGILGRVQGATTLTNAQLISSST